MKFSTTAVLAACTAAATAAPAATPSASAPSAVASSSQSSTPGTYDVPREAIIGQFSFDDDEYPLVTSHDNHNYVVLLNTTIVKQAYEDLENDKGKRDAKWGWLHFWTGQPFVKRDAEADAKWGWLHFWTGQPFVKRDADANAEAKWGWLHFWTGQPFVKREEEEPEADIVGN